MSYKLKGRGRLFVFYVRMNFRFQIFIPADGMSEFQHNLGELIQDYDNGN